MLLLLLALHFAGAIAVHRVPLKKLQNPDGDLYWIQNVAAHSNYGVSLSSQDDLAMILQRC
jgi:hypothetical protein